MYDPAATAGRPLAELAELKEKMLVGLKTRFCAGLVAGHDDAYIRGAFEAELMRF